MMTCRKAVTLAAICQEPAIISMGRSMALPPRHGAAYTGRFLRHAESRFAIAGRRMSTTRQLIFLASVETPRNARATPARGATSREERFTSHLRP